MQKTMTRKSKILFGIGTTIVIFIVLFLTVGRKVLNLKKLEYSGISFKFEQYPTSVVDLLMSDFIAKVILKIQNFSNIDYTIQQSALQIYSKKGNLIATPNEPIETGFILKANANNEIPARYKFDYTNILTLIEDNGLASSVSSALNVIKNFFTSKTLGTDLIIKGFIVSDGITININQTISV
jgi:hypothetical protein